MKRIVTFSIIALFLAACSQNTPEATQKKADALKVRISKMEKQLKELQTEEDTVAVEKVYPVKVSNLELTDIDNKIEYSANLIPFEELYIAPASPGKITKIYVEVGDRVSKGQKLVQMDKTQLNQAKIQLESLKKDFERLKALRETGSIPEQQFDQMKTQMEVTQSNVDFLEENTTLYAPFDGVITGKYFEDSETYSGAPNTQAGKAAIVTLEQVNVLKAVLNVSEQYYRSLNEGVEVGLTSEVYPNEIFPGKIMNIYPTIDPLTRSFKVEIKVPNRNLKLRPGMFSRVRLILGQTKTIVVPAITVLQQEGTNTRYIFINKNGVAKRVNVTIGQRFNDKYEIISDQIKEGDQLIVAGQAVISDNNKVKVVK